MVSRWGLRSPRDRLLSALVVGALLEILWTVYLGWQLPRHYNAHHWALAWVGLDIAEVATLLASAWAAWRRRAILIPFLTAAATLLLLDAWFDVTTAGHGSARQSLLVALVVELPSAAVLLWVARHAVFRLVATHFTDRDLGLGPLSEISLEEAAD